MKDVDLLNSQLPSRVVVTQVYRSSSSDGSQWRLVARIEWVRHSGTATIVSYVDVPIPVDAFAVPQDTKNVLGELLHKIKLLVGA